MSFFEDLVKMKGKYPIAISKTSGPAIKDNCKVMFRSRECVETWTRIQGSGKEQALQRYIPSSWNISVYRCQYDALKHFCKKALIRKNNKNIYEYPGMKKNIFANKLYALYPNCKDTLKFCTLRKSTLYKIFAKITQSKP